MQFIDLNLQNDQLITQALKIGFSKVKKAKIIPLNSGSDLNLVNSKELISIESTNSQLLRDCIRQKKPVLCNPLFAPNFYKDIGLIREAASQETVFEIPISEFLKTNFVYRAKLINQTRNFISRCMKLKAKFVFTSRAVDLLGLKSPQEIIAIASTLFSLTKQQSEFSISTRPEKMLEYLR
ncbi:MAG: RNase P subunit p30 family protein [Candidatus Micrarchaeota archaeon]